MSGARHLYVHLPFCAARCGYCDFVTVVGREGRHGEYVDALIAELELERGALSERLETVFLGGGTPTFTEAGALRRLLRALPDCEELTVEANPETVTPELASLLAAEGVTRVSLGAQSFQPHLLETLERRASPDVVRRAFHHLRAANFDNISLDLIYGIPGQSTIDLDRDIDEALALAPEHLSWYELEAKPGTRFTHAHGDELARQAEEMEDYFERVVDRMTGAGYRWYETANFCLTPAPERRVVTCARDTTLATGWDGTTSGSASAPSRRWALSGGATRRASASTSRRSQTVSARCVSSRSCRRRSSAKSG